MGTTLTGTTPQDTYDSLIKVTDNGPLSATAKYLSDGLGNDSALALSTARVGVGTSSPAYALDTRGISAVFNAGLDGTTQPTLYLGHPSYTTTYLNKISTSVSAAAVSQVMQFSVANGASTYADVMTLNGSGNVGIGTNAPDTLLTLGSVPRTENTAGIKIFRGGSTTDYATYGFSGNAVINAVGVDLVLQRQSTEVARFTTAGLCFGGDYLAANALDDYEEGTFTATLKGSSSDPSTPVTTTANYTKIGRQVTISIMFANVNTTGASGSVTVLGVPFSCVTAGVGSAITENFTFGATRTTVSSLIDSAAATTIRFSVSGNDTSFENLSHNAGTGRYLYTSITYFV